ncbi:required for meiotic nuclear division 5-like protein B [Phyllostomus discolor]|uniref:Required for meiotic nuclear division 5-like protein B n=1 Tax=Phyllostomus discolor TaxID=89673 RepID=A0A833YXM3_9CHIR|nr:required for meiotic nuclear division 5-like protein B [Phyllostomus discolor]
MEQCTSVEREVDKVLQKFLTYGQHFEQSLEELLHCVGRLRAELARAALQGTSLSATLSSVMSQCCQKIRDAVQKLASDHKDIHGSVSRVGKAIDRVSVSVQMGAGSWSWCVLHVAHPESRCGECEC